MAIATPLRNSIKRQRLGLQLVMVAACLVPIGAGLAGVVMGSRMIDKVGMGISEAGISQDSQFRYLSGLLLAVGLCFLSLVPRIERMGSAMRLLTFIVFIGGLARLAGMLALGLPSRPMLGGLTMELAVTPLLCLWQMSLGATLSLSRLEGISEG